MAGSQEEWQIYGFDGELLAEYRAMTAASSPEKEYGYRNGELLVTATGRHNVALAANGAVATASSAHTCCGFSTWGAINGNNRGPWGNGEGWNDATENVVPDWIQVEFAGSKTIDEISVFSLHDNYTQENTPTETQTFSLYGLLAFDVQYWNGSSWVTIPGGSVTGNNKVWRKFTFSAITTSKIRVYINSVPDAWSRVVEIQAFGTSSGGEKVQWLVPDHLGTPRIIVDETGNRANVKRHDYQPFGEELFTGTGGRTVALGYAGDGVRQQFTAYERDAESGLDVAGARFYASTQGRFTSLDPLMASAVPANPQTFNRYSYVSNSPMTQIDPSGMFGISPGGSQLGGIGNLAFFTSDQGTSASTDEEAKRNMQTAKMTPVAPEELAVYRANIGEMLSVPTCRNFIRQLLDEAKMVTGKSYNDVLGTFDTVKFYWKNEPPWYGGHAMFEQGKPAATISDAVKTEKFINEGRTRFLISQTTHSFFAETLHHVGVNGAYGDGAMAQALNNILVKQGKDKAQTFDLRGINEKEINRASLYWHPKVENFCRAPRK